MPGSAFSGGWRWPLAFGAVFIAVGLIDGAQLALWIGEGAKTWSHEAYVRAAQLKANGASPEQIRDQTGVWWGPDGKPRQEIDDSGATVAPGSGALGDALKHPALFEAYPDMLMMPAKVSESGFFDSGLSGHYDSQANGKPEGITLQASPEQMKGGLIHEAQHAIQRREGFDPGGMPAGVSLPELQRSRAAWEAYARIMGEAEARAAAARANMTPEQRRTTPPGASYDVPMGELRKR